MLCLLFPSNSSLTVLVTTSNKDHCVNFEIIFCPLETLLTLSTVSVALAIVSLNPSLN